MATKNLPKEETKLPKPETDLPIPEKELPKTIPATDKPEATLTEAYKSRSSFLSLKLLTLALVLILIFMSGFALLRNDSTKTLPLSPTPTKAVGETTNWKTYTGNGFSFNFPSEWKYSEKNETFIPIKTGTPSLPGRIISFGTEYNQAEINKYYGGHTPGSLKTKINLFYSSDKLAQNYNTRYFATTTLEPQIKNVDIGDIKSTQYTWNCQDVCYHIIFKQNQMVFDLGIENFSSYKDEDLKIIDQILSTFKFTQ